jgi:hypothetical protein
MHKCPFHVRSTAVIALAKQGGCSMKPQRAELYFLLQDENKIGFPQNSMIN